MAKKKKKPTHSQMQGREAYERAAQTKTKVPTRKRSDFPTKAAYDRYRYNMLRAGSGKVVEVGKRGERKYIKRGTVTKKQEQNAYNRAMRGVRRKKK